MMNIDDILEKLNNKTLDINTAYILEKKCLLVNDFERFVKTYEFGTDVESIKYNVLFYPEGYEEKVTIKFRHGGIKKLLVTGTSEATVLKEIIERIQ